MPNYLSAEKAKALGLEDIKTQSEYLTPDKVNALGLEPPQVSQEQPQGFLTRTTEDISKRIGRIGEELTFKDFFEKAPERGLRITGQVAGGIGDVVGELLKSTYDVLMPEKTKEQVRTGVRELLQTKVGKTGLGALAKGQEAYGDFKKSYPEFAKDIEAVVNIATLIPIRAGTKESINILKDIKATVTVPTIQTIDKALEKTIIKGVEKGIRLSVVGKKSAPLMQAYFDKAKSAVQKIVANKDNLILTNKFGEPLKGELPKSLKQFSQAINQTKTAVFEQYDAMAKEAGKSGAIVKLTPIKNELDIVINNPVLQDIAPDTIKYAKQRADSLAKRSIYTTTEAQEAITKLNNSLDIFYANPTYDTASKAYIDSLIANNLRKNLDAVIEGLQGKGYQELKNSYGALKTIEKDVTHRAIREGRKRVKGLLDFSDVFSGAYAVHGMITMNPAVIGAAGAAKGIAKLYIHLNDPNRIVKSMFEKTEKLLQKRGMIGKPIDPQSWIGKLLAKGQTKDIPPDILKRITYEPETGFVLKGTPQDFTVIGKPYTKIETGQPKIGYEGKLPKELPTPAFTTPAEASAIAYQKEFNLLQSPQGGSLLRIMLNKQRQDALNKTLGIIRK